MMLASAGTKAKTKRTANGVQVNRLSFGIASSRHSTDLVEGVSPVLADPGRFASTRRGTIPGQDLLTQSRLQGKVRGFRGVIDIKDQGGTKPRERAWYPGIFVGKA